LRFCSVNFFTGFSEKPPKIKTLPETGRAITVKNF
jgi:hypothetical protein